MLTFTRRKNGLACHDPVTGSTFCVMPTQPSGDWKEVTRKNKENVEDLLVKLASEDVAKNGRRGRFSTATIGVGYGGGQPVSVPA